MLFRGALPPADWSVVSSARSSERVSFFLALPQRNLAQLDRLFWALSDPDSEQYGEFMTTEQIQSLVSPPWAERQELIQWLVEQGVERDQVLDYGDSLEVNAPVRVASALFDATFHLFEHSKSGRRLVRAMGDVSMPEALSARVEMVYGLTGFPVPHLSTHRREAGVGQPIMETDAVIPQSLYAMYGLPRNTTVGN